MTDDIKLPELPGFAKHLYAADKADLIAYARAAVLEDRERRDQPVPGAETLPHDEMLRSIVVEAIREATGCPDLKGRDGEYLSEKVLAKARALHSCASHQTTGDPQ